MVAPSSFCASLFCIDSTRMLLGVACFARIVGNMPPIAYLVRRVAPDTDLNLFQTKEQSMSNYGFKTTLSTAFDVALPQVLAALKAEGFGVLSDIDVAGAMKEKLDIDLPPYRILGACNPPLAHRALQAEPDIGLLLPCNVIVRQDADGQVPVGFLDPQLMVGLTGNPKIREVADDAAARLHRVCDSLAGRTTP